MKKLIVVLAVVLWGGVAFGGAISFGDLSTWDVSVMKENSYAKVVGGMLEIQAGNDPIDAYDQITIQKSFDLCEGEELSGWSKFWTYDYPPYNYDSASVSVGWIGGYQTLWEKDIITAYDENGDPEGLAGTAETDWQRWAFTAPDDGFYDLIFYAQGDDQMESIVYHRDLAIGCRCRSVPEPTSIALVGLGLVFIASVKRRFK